uniref:Uncharacterized protein n=1 Tax=Arundo donax TaxID=35708 RepID=A0A0A9GZA0_ARUDO
MTSQICNLNSECGKAVDTVLRRNISEDK